MGLLRVYAQELARLLYWVGLRLFVQSAPRKLSYLLAGLAGSIMYHAASGKRKVLDDGFRFLFGKASPEIEKEAFRIYAFNSTEIFMYPSLNAGNIRALVEYRGLEHIERALKKGKGVMLFHAHFGNEEFLMPAIGHLGLKVSQMASRHPPEERPGLLFKFPNFARRYAFRMRIGYREMLPVNFVYTDKGPRKALEALKKNELLLWAVDGREGEMSMELDFMGRKARYSEGAIRVAMKTGAEVVPVFIVRKEDHTHLLIAEEPMTMDATGDAERDAKVNTQKFISLLDRYVKKYPAQYLRVFWYADDYFVR
ncbi:MAG: lysophospholipid acyltransferase family protein [Deltaproteobacteria bacterium]|nr:lysophospholipid acyltransferase family protein [Deltaproteobacteria bacterium]